ncbi:hypothetical protein B0H14DRAFT_2630483 [Mycena olivaceomarginata]|nr:hypothetical protein B0H14DRAFT_2630483 [Mycena olivaceomarginata]
MTDGNRGNILRNYYSRQRQTRTEGARQIANANRRKYDAEYREAWVLPGCVVDQEILEEKQSGQFFKYYTPLLNKFNRDLAGVRVPTGEEDGDDEDRPALEGKSQS